MRAYRRAITLLPALRAWPCGSRLVNPTTAPFATPGRGDRARADALASHGWTARRCRAHPARTRSPTSEPALHRRSWQTAGSQPPARPVHSATEPAEDAALAPGPPTTSRLPGHRVQPRAGATDYQRLDLVRFPRRAWPRASRGSAPLGVVHVPAPPWHLIARVGVATAASVQELGDRGSWCSACRFP